MKNSTRCRVLLFILSGFLIFRPLNGQERKQRYISLAPSTTEILFALGLQDQILGVSSYCDYPDMALTKENIGDFSHPNIEKILSLKPDYIFCTGLEQAPLIVELRRLNLNVYVSDPSNTKELFESILDIGKITGKNNEAATIVSQMKDKITAVVLKTKDIPKEKRPKVFIEIWHSPLMTVGKGSFVDELITLAGGVNIAYGTKRPYCIFSPEEVISRNPDCVILTYMDPGSPVKLLGARFGWGKINAVRNNRLYNDINPDLLLRPGPRVAEGVKELYNRFYPENE